ncbi:MAG: hypothetical protein JJE52_11265 [Acidimicrobiia bacterium]|nr:hypothetical protein [Acidimicrobiia bacterium]
MQLSEGKLSWKYSADGNDYSFRLAPTPSKIELEVQVTRPLGGRIGLSYTGKGTFETVRATGRADFADGELASLEISQDELAGTMELSIAAAGAGDSSIDFELPGLMFKYLIPVGPVPVTVGITTKIIGNIQVPAQGSATASSRFSYSGSTGFTYDGTDVEASANMAGATMNPEPADAAALIGNAVDAQFGVAFPRFSISLFDQFLVPYIHTGFIAGARLNWGPVCKSAYVTTVVQGGYDFDILGIPIASDQVTFYEDTETADQDGCSQ